jgi:hypothetical protein
MYSKVAKINQTLVACDFGGLGKNNDVIDLTFGETNVCQHLIHNSLKNFMGIFQTKWQELPLV